MTTEATDGVETGTEDEDTPSSLVLVFTAEGGAVLEENGEPVWMSDDDDDFQETYEDTFLDVDQDGRDVLNWLEEEGWLEDEEEKASVKLETESEDGDSLD